MGSVLAGGWCVCDWINIGSFMEPVKGERAGARTGCPWGCVSILALGSTKRGGLGAGVQIALWWAA